MAESSKPMISTGDLIAYAMRTGRPELADAIRSLVREYAVINAPWPEAQRDVLGNI